jgi:hypothetical protein
MAGRAVKGPGRGAVGVRAASFGLGSLLSRGLARLFRLSPRLRDFRLRYASIGRLGFAGAADSVEAADQALLAVAFFFAGAFLADLTGASGGWAMATGIACRPSPIFLASSERARA